MRRFPRPLPPYNIAMNFQDGLYINREREYTLRKYMPSDAQAERLADFFAVCSDPSRVKILSVLAIGDMCVGDIAIVVKLHPSTVSHQLKLLKDRRMVSCHRLGKVIYYRLCDKYIEAVLGVGAERLEKFY